MSKMKDLAIEAREAALQIAEASVALKDLADAYQRKYAHLLHSDDATPPQLEEAASRRLNIHAGIVRFVESSPEQLFVQFR